MMKGAGKMTGIRYAETDDRAFWYSLDKALPGNSFEEKVRRRECYLLTCDGKPAGLLRYNLFWDNTPFCNLLYIDEPQRGKGFGRLLMEYWEQDMKRLGYGLVMTSTQSDESAQHFYRRLGYADCGGFIIPVTGYEQPLEIIFAKSL